MILRPTKPCFKRATFVATIVLCALGTKVAAEDISAAYSGKTISFVVAGARGSLMDKYARAIGRYMVKHIPGSPVIRFRNMEGGSGNKATLWLYNKAPRDGLTIAALTPKAIVGPLIGDAADKNYDPMKFKYLGNATSPIYVCISRLDAPATEFGLIRKRRLVMGALQVGGPTQDIAHALMNLAGARFRMVPRYRDSAQLLAALEHGEVHGACGFSWSNLWARWPDLIKDNKVKVFLQIALTALPDLTARKVPIMWDFVTDPGRRAALELLARTQQIGQPYAAPPKVPRQRVTALRVAFERTMKDLEFKADARKARLNFSPTLGDDMERIIEKMYLTPKDIVERARAARRAGEPAKASNGPNDQPLDGAASKG
jgi:tripartite-type tricarboxylate transporter receptor subunit TctC